VTKLTNPATGHQINVGDDVSADFWKAAGYRADEKSSTAKKAPAKQSATQKSSK